MPAFKACVLGEAGVGKTTLIKMLQNESLNGPRKPTIGVNIEKVGLDNGNCCMWDLAGQRRFQFMWNEFIKGSQLNIVVTDSTVKNVMLTKDLIERHLTTSAAKIIAIANKQDMEGHMNPEDIQAALGVPTFGLVGTDIHNHDALRKIIEAHLNQE